VVNDWTLEILLVVLFVVAVAPIVPLLWPPRSALAVVALGVSLAGADGGETVVDVLDVRVTRRRSDPAFAAGLEESLRDEIRGLGGSVAEDEDRIDIEETP
jgi:hypothetical protein